MCEAWSEISKTRFSRIVALFFLSLDSFCSYHIQQKSDPLNQFAIDQYGNVTLRNKLDRETKSRHEVFILAIDNPNSKLPLTLIDIMCVFKSVSYRCFFIMLYVQDSNLYPGPDLYLSVL